MNDTLETLLPVLVSLLLGAWLSRGHTRSTVRDSMRIEAADQLAALPAMMWAQEGENDWVDLNTALTRLQIRLDMAGVPWDLTAEVDLAAKVFWQEVYEAEGPDGETLWFVHDKADLEWMRASGFISQWLGANNLLSRFAITARARRTRPHFRDPATGEQRHWAKSRRGRFATQPGGSRDRPDPQ